MVQVLGRVKSNIDRIEDATFLKNSINAFEDPPVNIMVESSRMYNDFLIDHCTT